MAAKKELEFAGYRLTSDESGLSVERGTVDTSRPGDHGADPLGDGTFRMVPSGDVVGWEERCRRLGRR